MRAIIYLLLCIGWIAAPAAGEDAFVRYIAGLETLRAARNLSEEQKACYYKRLVKLTGMTAAQAQERIAGFADRPLQWKKIQDQVIELLDKKTETDKE